MTKTTKGADDLGLMLLNLLQGFYWFDEGLQNYLSTCGWPDVTRPQSMVMANIIMGVTRPSEIARRLGVSRQAIHVTINSMIDLDMVELVDDPESKRVKVVKLTTVGEAMRVDAKTAMRMMVTELASRLGEKRLQQAAAVLGADWGPPLTFESAQARRRPEKRGAARRTAREARRVS
jgi:DNA-binding MarR family transcriptional regulator